MKIEKQVCSLSQAKKLKELGIEQVGYFSHQHYPKTSYRNEAQEVVNPLFKEGATDAGEWFSAFTLSELGAMLDSETYTQRTGSEDSKYANWEWINDGNETGSGLFGYEVFARADMLINCLESGSLSAETCNKRLLA